MIRAAWILLALVLSVQMGFAQPARNREFTFVYRAIIHGSQPGENVRVWIPVASSDANQQVEIVRRELPPAAVRFTVEHRFGNRLAYFESKSDAAGSVALAVTYRVLRREVVGTSGVVPTADELRMFLRPDSNVPLGGKLLSLLEGKPIPGEAMKRAQLLYDTVDDHMEYRKDQPGWGRGDAVWACESGFGNCTDFHSLFISLARSKQLPAKFEIGFSLPPAHGKGEIVGYHCWAYFSPDSKAWVPVDISEARKHPELRNYYFGNLTADRVAFSVGRDLVLEPRQDGGPINFMIFPYAEAQGKVVAQDQIEMKCTFEDVGVR